MPGSGRWAFAILPDMSYAYPSCYLLLREADTTNKRRADAVRARRLRGSEAQAKVLAAVGCRWPEEEIEGRLVSYRELVIRTAHPHHILFAACVALSFTGPWGGRGGGTVRLT